MFLKTRYFDYDKVAPEVFMKNKNERLWNNDCAAEILSQELFCHSAIAAWEPLQFWSGTDFYQIDKDVVINTVFINFG